MPCDQVRTTELALEGAQLHLVVKSLEALGLKATLDASGKTIRVLARDGTSGYFANGRLVMNGRMPIEQNQLRREYSRQSVMKTAKDKGWQLRFLKNGDIEATKRRLN